MATNTLTGTTGNDILNAPGSVTTDVVGLQGNDTITLQLTQDLAHAGAGDDTVLINVTGQASNYVDGGAGSDTVTIGTAVVSNSASIYGGDGDDSVNLAGGAGLTTNVSNLVAGNKGNDTIVATNSLTLTTVGGGQGTDVITLRGGGTSPVVQGGKGADTLTLAGTFSNATISGNEGFDVIQATGVTGTTSRIGGGKGGDSIAIGTNAVATVVGGYLNDTITVFGPYAGGVVYGDTGSSSGSGTGAEADGADLISFTAGTIAAAASIYGGGGNDTLRFAAAASNGAMVVDGGTGADLIGNTGMIVDIGSSTVTGGAGNDTVIFASLASAVILGGDGADSIYGATVLASASSVNGGAGNDTINLAAGNGFASAIGVLTVNGGDGADSIILGSYTAATASGESGNVIGNVVYGSSDIITLVAGNGVAAGANWLGNTQLFVASNRASAVLASSIDGMSQAGSVLVFKDGSDLVIGLTRTAGATTGSLINIINGASAIKTTATGNVTLNSDNFGFTVTTTNNNISFTFS